MRLTDVCRSQDRVFKLAEGFHRSLLNSEDEIIDILRNPAEVKHSHILSKYYMRGVILNYLSEGKLHREVKRGRIPPTTYFNENYLAIILRAFLRNARKCVVEVDKRIDLGKKKNGKPYYLYPDISISSNGRLKAIISTKNDLGHERSNWAEKFEEIVKSFAGRNPKMEHFDKDYRLEKGSSFLVVNTIANSGIRGESDISDIVKNKELVVPSNVVFLLKEHPNPRKDDDESYRKMAILKNKLEDGDFVSFIEPMFEKIATLTGR